MHKSFEYKPRPLVQTNNSLSKQKYSFNKAKRFIDNKKTNENYNFYNVSNKNKKQKYITFGFGDRSNFLGIKNRNIPGPGYYNITNPNKKLIIKTMKRDTGRDNNINNSMNTPGPGTYNPSKKSNIPLGKFLTTIKSFLIRI